MQHTQIEAMQCNTYYCDNAIVIALPEPKGTTKRRPDLYQRQMSIRSDTVGQRVHVYWADENEWFSGQVQRTDDVHGYFVLYDDGDERWESLAQRVEFEEREEEEEQQQYRDEESGNEGEEHDIFASQEQQRPGGRAPEMMEPPASPNYGDGAYDDDDDGEDRHDEFGEEDDTQRHEQDVGGEDDDGSISERDGGDNDGDEGIEKIDLAIAGIARTARRFQEDSIAGETGDQQRADSDDDGEQSVAMSEVPIMFERIASGRNSTRSPAQPLTSHSTNSSRSVGVANTGVHLPVRGVLRGKVLHASHLPSIPATSQKTTTRSHRRLITPPRAFVKIAFVEAAVGDKPKHSNVMLRCKNALASTSVAMQSNHPVWNGEEREGGGAGAADGEFQMQLVPPAASPKEPSAWLQLRGDVLFSVYSVSTNDRSDDTDDEEEKTERGRRRQVHDFIGQSVLSLKEILHHVLFGGSLSVTRRLPLQSRQGKPLVAYSSSSSRAGNAFEDGHHGDEEASVVMVSEIVVSFDFEPTYLEDTKQRVSRSRPTSQSTRPLIAKDRGLTASARSLTSQPKSKNQNPKQQAKAQSKPNAQAKKAAHTSSSTINRRKFEKQVDQQNVAFAKRLEWRDQRRARLSEHAKAQAKSKQPIPQHGTMKLGHKASSNINRTKFQQQMRQDNRAMEKRLHAIIIKDASEGKEQSKGCAKDHDGVLEFSDVGFDDLDKDKVLARDRRHHKLREQDFLMARAQAKYQQQNQVVEEVMKLQGELAELKAQVFNAKAAVTRLNILNNKDQHLCKCLRSAAESSSSSVVGSNGPSGNRSVKRKTTKQEEYGDDVSSSGDTSVTRQRKELELLKKEAMSLQSERQSSSEELRSCNQQEQELDDEIHKLTSQLRFVQKKQAFQLRMSSRVDAELQFAKEMKKKQQLLELSKDEEEVWALYQVQQELTQLQIAVQVLKERSSSASTMDNSTKGSSPSSSSAAACEYLKKKIERQKLKLEQLEQEQSHFQREYELLLVSGEQEMLRRQVHELQQTLFLCHAQQKHARVAQKHAHFTDEKLAIEFQSKLFQEQTETEVLFKKKTKQ